MLDKIFNPAPTIYKWDKFWVGFLPALVLPVVSVLALYVIMALSSKFIHHEEFPFDTFLHAMQSTLYFLRISTVCCMPNAALFFFFIRLNYNNASRAVVVTTMLYVLLIVIKDVS
jgi:hypothetical protein